MILVLLIKDNNGSFIMIAYQTRMHLYIRQYTNLYDPSSLKKIILKNELYVYLCQVICFDNDTWSSSYETTLCNTMQKDVSPLI